MIVDNESDKDNTLALYWYHTHTYSHKFSWSYNWSYFSV